MPLGISQFSHFLTFLKIIFQQTDVSDFFLRTNIIRHVTFNVSLLTKI